MEKFIIAGIKTEYNVCGNLLRERSEKYRADFDDSETQIKFKIKEEYINKKKEDIPYLSWDEHEYMATCSAFYSELLRFGGMMLHSSCVEKDGFAYLFSARSGTGKSTHTHLWLENLENTEEKEKTKKLFEGIGQVKVETNPLEGVFQVTLPGIKFYHKGE